MAGEESRRIFKIYDNFGIQSLLVNILPVTFYGNYTNLPVMQQ